MKKVSGVSLLTILSVLLFLAACSSSVTQEGKQEAREDGVQVVKKNYDNGSPLSEVEYKDGVRHGIAKNFYKTGELHTEMIYQNGKKEGEAKWYYKDGTVYQTTSYENDLAQGTRKRFHRNGELMAEIPFLNGHPGSGLREYTESGKPSSKHEALDIAFKTVNNIATTGEFKLQMSVTEGKKKVKFYMGDLLEGKYLHDDLLEIPAKSGVGEYIVRLTPGTFVSRDMNIIAEAKTHLGNPHIIQKTYRMRAENSKKL